MCDASCQPTTMREKTSITNAKNNAPSQQRKAVSSSNVGLGVQSVELVSSFNGVGTLADSIDGAIYFGDSIALADTTYAPLADTALSGGCQVVTPFSMTVAVEHLTQLTIGHFQTHISSANRVFRLDARIQSPAGVPHGTCAVERIARGIPTRIASVPVNHGVCAARVRTATVGVVNFRVTFTGAGWQTAQATSHTIRAK
jgi:hypothetical protein